MVVVVEAMGEERREEFKGKCFEVQEGILAKGEGVSLKLVRDVCITNANFKDKKSADLAFQMIAHFVSQQDGQPATAPKGYEKTLGSLLAEIIRAVGQLKEKGPSTLARELKYLEDQIHLALPQIESLPVLHQLVAGFVSQTLHSPKLLHKIQQSIQDKTSGFEDPPLTNQQLYNFAMVSSQKNTWWFNNKTALPQLKQALYSRVRDVLEREQG